MAEAASIITAETPPKVYCYSRWSTPEQAKGDSFRRQFEAAAKWAERRGYVLDDKLRITDEGVSAFRGSNSLDGGLSRFIEACKRGLIEEGSFLLVESVDRISRMVPRSAQRLVNEIVDNGVTIVTLNDGQEYDAHRLDNDPTSLIISIMVSWRAHEESKTKGRRVAEAWAEKRKQVRADPSKRLTLRAPAWLSADGEAWAVDEAKAATVRRIYSLALEGVGEHRTAAILNEEGVSVLGRGKRWHRSSVCKLLSNEAVLGRLVPGRIEYIDGKRKRGMEEPIDGAYPAIISEADWLAVRALKDGRSRNAKGRHANRPVAHYLAGLASCPLCGSSMTRVFKGKGPKGGKAKLVCSAAKSRAGCAYKSVPIADVEAAMLSGWGHLFASVPADDVTHGLTARRNDLAGAIEAREEHLRDLAEAFDRNPSGSAARVIRRVEEELRTMRDELGAAEERCAMADGGLIASRLGGLQELLEDEEALADHSRINAALKVLFARVVVDYRTGVLAFRWRQGGEASVVYAWPEH